MAACSEAEVHSLLVYKSPAWKGGVLYLFRFSMLRSLVHRFMTTVRREIVLEGVPREANLVCEDVCPLIPPPHASRTVRHKECSS